MNSIKLKEALELVNRQQAVLLLSTEDRQHRVVIDDPYDLRDLREFFNQQTGAVVCGSGNNTANNSSYHDRRSYLLSMLL